MGWRKLSPRSTRRIAQTTGLDIVHAAGCGGYVHWFLTADHRHGHYDIKTSEYELLPPDDPCTHTSCGTYFPDHPNNDERRRP
jgi:hypothetical protein